MFLSRFIARFAPDLAIPIEEEARHRFQTSHVHVQTEAVTDAGRFIDILIDVDDGHRRHAIAIENKIWAGDQNDQVAHYLDWMARRARAFGGQATTKLIYLSPGGGPPSAASMDPAAFRNSVAGLRAATASYGDIVEWLADCKASVKAPRVAAFIDDLTGHIRGMILGEKRMQDDDALVALILADERKLEAFFKAQALGGSVRSELLCRFIEDIGRISGGRRSFSSGYWDSNRYRIRLDLGDGILAVLGTDYPNFGWVWYGLETDEPNGDIEGLQARAAEIFGVRSHGFLPPGGEPDCEAVRIWRHKCTRQGPLGVSETWTQDTAPWLALQNGNLAKAFVNWGLEAKRQLHWSEGKPLAPASSS